MAVTRMKLCFFVVCTCWLQALFAAVNGQSRGVPDPDDMKAWARTVKQQLVNDQRDKANEELLKQGYNNNMDGGQYRVLDGKQIVQEMADELAGRFAKKVAALRLLKEAAEEAVAEHHYDPDLLSVDYYDMNDTDRGKNRFEMVHHRRFRQPVNLTASGVHIPLEIYRGDARILNGLNWSRALDPVFRSNFDAEPQLLAWQFFGSRDGFMRVYPAHRWTLIPELPDLYDVRNRPWYIQGLASPKDMLVLMDVSGSIHGQTLELMKLSVKTLLNTLEENDYVNVAWFSDRVGFVPCFRTFVQANSRNKRKLFDGIDALEASNMTNYGRALEFAFQQFANFSETKRDYEGAECHRVIMLFTDGGTERADDVAAKYNADGGVRIFTYSLGPPLTHPVHTLRSLACQNRGYFDSITATGAVRTKVQQYSNVLARPMALSHNESESYSTVYADAGGLGLVVTTTLPVYNRSSGDGDNQTTVGVVGVDTPVSDIAAVLPLTKTGPNSYAFAINPNGFVILHPRMPVPDTYLDDAPDVDFLDLEGGDQSPETYLELLRKDMIDEKTDSKPYLMYVEAGDANHILQKNVTYHFTPIANSSISLGVAVPSDRRVYIDSTEHVGGRPYPPVRNLGISLKEAVLVAPWNYCPGLMLTTDDDPTETVKRLLEEVRVNGSQCDQALLRRLLLDRELTKQMYHIWNSNQKVGASGSPDVNRTAVFVGTEGGLMRVSPATAVPDFRRISDPHRATYYKKGLHYPDWAFFVSGEAEEVADEDSQHRTVTAVKAISTSPVVDGERYQHRLAVYGVRWNETGLHHMLRGLQASVVAGVTTSCDDADQLWCFLLDDGGYIMSSNHPEHASQCGRFLGQVDAPLMWHLTEASVYKRRLEYDYHAVCARADTRTSAADVLPTVGALLRSVLHALADAVLWFALSAGWGSLLPAASGSGEVGVTVKLSTYPCTKVRTLYYFTPLSEGAAPVEGEVTCGNCSRPFSAIRVQQSNLLLVAAAAPDASCPLELCGPVRLNHEPEQSKGPDVCQMEPRYRRRPQTCFANHSMEDTSECNAANRPWDWPTTVATTMLTLLVVALAS